MKIFRAKGLRRYRKKAIPKVKQRIKYEKKMKLLRKKGYKPYKGTKIVDDGVTNLNVNVIHSVKL